MNMNNSVQFKTKVTNMKNIVNSTSTTTSIFTEDEKKKILARVTTKIERLLNGDASAKISRNDVGLLCGGISNSAVQAKFGNKAELTLASVKAYVMEDHIHQKMDKAEKLTHQISKLSNDEKAKLMAILTK